MACALSGAYLGADSIPKELMDSIENREFIDNLCRYFHEAYLDSDEQTAAVFKKYKDNFFPAVLIEETEKVDYKGIKNLKIYQAMKNL